MHVFAWWQLWTRSDLLDLNLPTNFLSIHNRSHIIIIVTSSSGSHKINPFGVWERARAPHIVPVSTNVIWPPITPSQTTFDFSTFHFHPFQTQIVSICSIWIYAATQRKTVINCELYRCTTYYVCNDDARTQCFMCQAFGIRHEICMECKGLVCMIGFVVIKRAIGNWQLILLLWRILSKYVFISSHPPFNATTPSYLYMWRFLIWNYTSDLCDWSWWVRRFAETMNKMRWNMAGEKMKTSCKITGTGRMNIIVISRTEHALTPNFFRVRTDNNAN